MPPKVLGIFLLTWALQSSPHAGCGTATASATAVATAVAQVS